MFVNMVTVEFDDRKIPQFGRNKGEQLIIILLVHEPYRNITFPANEVESNSSSFALHDYCLSKANYLKNSNGLYRIAIKLLTVCVIGVDPGKWVSQNVREE